MAEAFFLNPFDSLDDFMHHVKPWSYCWFFWAKFIESFTIVVHHALFVLVVVLLRFLKVICWNVFATRKFPQKKQKVDLVLIENRRLCTFDSLYYNAKLFLELVRLIPITRLSSLNYLVFYRMYGIQKQKFTFHLWYVVMITLSERMVFFVLF